MLITSETSVNLRQCDKQRGIFHWKNSSKVNGSRPKKPPLPSKDHCSSHHLITTYYMTIIPFIFPAPTIFTPTLLQLASYLLSSFTLSSWNDLNLVWASFTVRFCHCLVYFICETRPYSTDPSYCLIWSFFFMVPSKRWPTSVLAAFDGSSAFLKLGIGVSSDRHWHVWQAWHWETVVWACCVLLSYRPASPHSQCPIGWLLWTSHFKLPRTPPCSA